MRVGLVYQDRKKWLKFRWVHSAFDRLGHETVRCRTIDEVRAADRDCDLLLFEQRNAGLNERELLGVEKSGNAIWSQWWFDLIRRDDPIEELESQHLVRQFGDVMQKMDVVFVKDTWLEEYAEFGVDAIHLDQGCPFNLPACEHHEAPEFDAIFVGSATKHYPERLAALRLLCDEGLRVAVAGDSGAYPPQATRLGWVDPFNLPAQFSRAAIVIHIDIRHDVPSYRSDSFWMKLGAGACVLKRGGIDDPQGPYFTHEELGGLLNATSQLLREPLRRSQIGRSARRWVMREHTYEHRIEELVRHVEGIKNDRTASRPAVPAV